MMTVTAMATLLVYTRYPLAVLVIMDSPRITLNCAHPP